MRYILLSLLVLISCNDERFYDNKIYKPNFEYEYKVEYFEKDELKKTDKLILTVEEGYNLRSMKTDAYWTLITKDEDGEKDKSNESVFLIDTEKLYYLKMPTFEYFYFLTFIDSPQISYKSFQENRIGLVRESTVQPTEIYKGITITKAEYRQVYQGKKELSIPSLSISKAHQIEAHSNSKLGDMKVLYWFDETIGFVQMEYNLPEYKKIVLTFEKSIELKDE